MRANLPARNGSAFSSAGIRTKTPGARSGRVQAMPYASL